MSTILPSTVPVDGRPSGEAYVEFTSAEEAMRAYQQKQKVGVVVFFREFIFLFRLG